MSYVYVVTYSTNWDSEQNDPSVIIGVYKNKKDAINCMIEKIMKEYRDEAAGDEDITSNEIKKEIDHTKNIYEYRVSHSWIFQCVKTKLK